MDITRANFKRGIQQKIDMQADREIYQMMSRPVVRGLSPSGLWKLINTGVDFLETIQPQVTIYPYGDFESRGKIKEA